MTSSQLPDAVDLAEPLAPLTPGAPHDASGEGVPTRDLAGLAPAAHPGAASSTGPEPARGR